ncbi:MAG: hypothetical protein WDW36_003498 [Sanguina aurantia]
MAPASPKIKADKRGQKKKVGAAQDSSEYVPPPPPGDEFAMPVREFVRPDNQLQLTDAELNEEVAKMLTANNPEASKNVARFNMKEKCYKFEPMVDQTIVVYATDGWLLHKGSDEAKKQVDVEKMEAEAGQRFQAEVDRASHERRDDANGDGSEPPDDSRQLRNQFNFSERAAQTSNFLPRSRETYTEPPPTATVSGTCSQSEIYDEYIKEYERQRQEEAQKSRGGARRGPPHPPPRPGRQHPRAQDPDHPILPPALAQTPPPALAAHSLGALVAASPLESPALQTSLRILDRMANQNMYEEISMDYKYWDDASDAFRPGEGSLLPLWKFTNEKAKRRAVTSICWNPLYQDLFAVGYGSYEFLKQGSGLISIYSLKNPSHPEFSFGCESGVMALSFHPELANLLAVGCYNGAVLVFDVHSPSEEPIYAANVRTGRHHDPVWDVFWQVDESQKALQFVSISSDGNVHQWILNKSELTHESLMKLRIAEPALPPSAASAPPPAAFAAAATASGNNPAPKAHKPPAEGQPDEGPGLAAGLAAGCCMDFCKMPGQGSIYLVGTEEGSIHKCSKAYSSQYLTSFQAHHLSVYAVRWNHIHPRTFLSASADWTVKLWDTQDSSGPILSFDLNDSVGDVAWSPVSSTIFAAITDDGKVHVYDLAENKIMPLCCQKIVKKARLTKLAFNPRQPILLIGDDKGTVTSMKLSPNLRQASKPEKGQKFEDLETAKLDKVIEVARKTAAH